MENCDKDGGDAGVNDTFYEGLKEMKEYIGELMLANDKTVKKLSGMLLLVEQQISKIN